jgi:hypothetical protein
MVNESKRNDPRYLRNLPLSAIGTLESAIIRTLPRIIPDSIDKTISEAREAKKRSISIYDLLKELKGLIGEEVFKQINDECEKRADSAVSQMNVLYGSQEDCATKWELYRKNIENALKTEIAISNGIATKYV